MNSFVFSRSSKDMECYGFATYWQIWEARACLISGCIVNVKLGI